MKRSIALTLVALFATGILVQAQRRRSHTKPTASAPPESEPVAYVREGQIVRQFICKGLPIPDGYVTAGETSESSCPDGAWVLKKKGTRLLAGNAEKAAPVEGRNVTLKEVSTDLINNLRQPLTVNGYLELSDWYFGPYYGQEASYYAFGLSDGSGANATVYLRRGNPLATRLRALLTSARGGIVQAKGKYTFIINELDGGKLSGSIYADLLSAEPADPE